MAKRGLQRTKGERKERKTKSNQTTRHNLSSLSADVVVRCHVRDVTIAVGESKF